MSVEKTKAGSNWWTRVFRAETRGVREDAVEVVGATIDERSDAPLGQVPNAPLSKSSTTVAAGRKPWQTRLDLTTREDSLVVAKAALAVMTGVPLDILAEPVRSAAAAMVDGVERGDPTAVARVYERMLETLHPDAVRQALAALALTVNDAAHAEVDIAAHKDEVPYGKGDERDWHRTWGLRLLPDDDDAFRDPAYLVLFNQESKGIRATSFDGRTSVTDARRRFEDEWAQLAPNTKLLCFTESGSDSVSLCFQIATTCGRRRTGKGNSNPGMAYFAGCYGGGRGLASSMNWAGWGKASAERKGEWQVPSPTSTTMHPAGAELARVQALEVEALATLERMATEQSPPLGAIFLEPLQGSNGVQFYRREFLLALRQLADRHKLPIIADEVLTGGGRTGKFFSYELYEGFTPDFVVFGKGLQTSGIAEVRRQGRAFSQTIGEWDLGTTTAGGDATRLLKGAQVMKRIREGGLMENAAKMGAVLVERLREVQRFHGVTPDASGAGLIVGMSHVRGAEVEVSTVSLREQRDRYLPPLTLSLEDIDEVTHALMKPLPDVRVLNAQRRLDDLRAELADSPVAERRDVLVTDIKRLEDWIAQLKGGGA